MPGTPQVELFTARELGNTTYLVADPESGEAIVVDPLRDIAQYLDRAEDLGLRITGSVETHVHNDFISGARELAEEVGARIYAAHDSEFKFEFEALRDGQEVPLGRYQLRARHTPGHTPQHLSYVLRGAAGEVEALFSGGALMVGAIARTDLFG